ncbi:uncharacterized protein DNG_00621 [Cephalotrichum gorgonifer]|uniref:Cytoskeleton-associated protein n=1 Tax=Cephalotrichum gorgonifer TaxID=2041049 RepID=A0AAE8SQZ6_9PEZI|nr:uncharacterized protein DNG_00621 [Cephalotrichum gorgonifer]
MGLLSFLRDERVALVGIGLAAGALISGMMTLVSIVIEDNKIEHPAPKTQYITQETEDSLQLDTLDKLINHPSFSIREVAIKILCDRAVNDPDALHELLYGITREDYDYRLQCLKALALLVFQTNADTSMRLHEPKTYSAMVRSLEVGLKDVESPKLDDPFWDEYYLRDMAERTNLLLLYQLIQKNGAEMLLRAKFVERWLARQNWGDTEHEIQKNFEAYKNNRRRNPIRDIIDCIFSAAGGVAALKRTGLLPTEERPPYRGEVWGITFSTVPRAAASGGPRDSELSDEELRRLRREAFVFNDGTRPVSGLDIVQRGPDG